MFSDPFTAVMALILLAFVGTLAVFLRLWSELGVLRNSLKDVRDTMRLCSLDLERQNQDIAAILRELRGLAGEKNGTLHTVDSSLSDLLERGLPNLEVREVSLSATDNGRGLGNGFGKSSGLK